MLLPLAFLGCVLAHLLSDFDLIPPLALTDNLNYDFGGSTVLHRQGARLTDDLPAQAGYIFSKSYSALPSKFILEFDFNIDGDSRSLYGDGLAFWLLHDRQDENTITRGELFGLNEYYKGTVIAVDTYRNGPSGRVFPRVVLMQNDGTKSYDKDHDGQANEIDNCGMRGIYNNHRVDSNKMRIAYSQEHKEIIVQVQFRDGWEPCMSKHVDLGTVRSIMVSASTGELSERNLISKIEVTDLTSSDYSEPGFELNFKTADQVNMETEKRIKSRKAKRQGISKKGFLFKLLLAGGGIYLAFFGFQQYKKYKIRQEDRLYKLM